MTNTDQAIETSPTADRIPPMAYLLTGCIGVIGCNSLGLGPIAPEVSASLGTSVPGVMAAASAFGLGTAASALLLANRIDRIGAWRMLRLAFAALAAVLLVSALAPTVEVLIVAQALAGLASGIALPAIYSNAAAIAPQGRESRTVGVVLTGWTLSMVAGVSLSAMLADFVHWRAVFAVVALLAAGAFAMLAMGGHRDNPVAGGQPNPLAALGIAGAKPLLLACGAFMTAFYGAYAYLGDHLHQALGQPLSLNGLAALVYGAGFGAAAFLDGLIDRYGAGRLMPVAFLGVAGVYVVLALASANAPAILAIMFFWGLANHFGLNMLIMRLTALDPKQRGAVMGLNSAVTYLAVFAGTSAFGPAYTTFGFAACAAVAAALTLVSAAVASFRRGPRLDA
jgi:MFS transporter, DHA1 family, inner membrane transport protein